MRNSMVRSPGSVNARWPTPRFPTPRDGCGDRGIRADVVGIFPSPAAFLWLATAVVVEAHDEWQVTRRYVSDVSMDELRKVIADKACAAAMATEYLAIQHQIA